MKNTKIYHYAENGIYIESSYADKCQITGVDLMPAYATTIKPPAVELPDFAIWTGKAWGIFKPVQKIEPTIEQQRAGMVISNAQARLKLIKLGLFDAIDKAIMSMPRNAPLYVLWEYGTNFYRTDENLITFCTDTLKMTAEDIDALFM